MRGDFIGFSFGNIHSSNLNIVRVSGGDFYNETLHPNFEDKQNFVMGRDGEYYYGSNYQAKEIKISIAFDSVTEKQFRLITNIFSTKKVCPLIFDERPYKMYLAKLASPINLDYVCFDEPIYEEEITEGVGIKGRDLVRKIDTGQKQRIYKGNGEIEFICVEPFARAPYKVLDTYEGSGAAHGYVLFKYDNVDEWKEASGILTLEEFNEGLYDKAVRSDIDGATVQISTYNPGDIASPFCLYIPFNNGRIASKEDDYFYIRLENEIMIFNNITKKTKDGDLNDETGIIINTSNHLIEGVIYSSGDSSWTTSGNVYNDYLIKGDFPKIMPIDIYDLTTNHTGKKQTLWMNCDFPELDSEQEDQDLKVRIFYDYLYY